MDDLQRQIEEAAEGIRRLKIEIRRRDLTDDGVVPTEEWLVRSINLETKLNEYTQWYSHLLDERTRLDMFAHARKELRRTRLIDL